MIVKLYVPFHPKEFLLRWRLIAELSNRQANHAPHSPVVMQVVVSTHP